MTRPLLNQTAEQLYAAVDRNKRDRAELLLVLQELRFRKTASARAVEARAKRYLAELDAPPATVSVSARPGVPADARPGKYAAVHAAAERAGAAVRLDWKCAADSFFAGECQHDSSSVYGTIHAICRQAGAASVAADALATALRHRQIGNARSQYCDGLPPIGWAEGWIDTAVSRGIVRVRPTASAAKLTIRPDPVTRQPRIVAPPPAHQREPKPMTDARRWTEEAVARLRTKLLDLSKKNPLISFKHGGRSASILRVVDERPDLVCAAIDRGAVGFEPLPGEDDTPPDELTPMFRIAYERARLVDETFLAATDALGDDERDARAWQQAERALRTMVRAQLGLPPLDYGKSLDIVAIARAHGFDPSYDLKASDDGDVAAHHEDDRLRVLLTARELDKRLKTIWERAGSHARETGIDTLHLAIGFMDWAEEDAPDTRLHAPLLLLPVRLDRAIVRGRYEYRLARRDERLKVNVALREKLRTDQGLELPALREEETPESYLIRAGTVLAQGRGLTVRRFITLAVLPPTILWEDLDPANWPEAAFAEHRLLPVLMSAAAKTGERQSEQDYPIDDEPWVHAAPALIRPADKSQHSALIDVAEGHDLAVEGPPGTGKSETITNMIATALAAGKRVLFVAEKQAALQVVANRLRASGFGSLLLELHGDSAQRAGVYDGLRERLRTRVVSDPGELTSQRLQLNQQRALLRRYLALVHQELGALGHSTYWLVWREIRLRAGIDRAVADAVAARWAPMDAKAIDRAQLVDRRARLNTFGAALAALDGDQRDGERTRWVEATRLDPFDQRRQLEVARDAATAAGAMARADEEMRLIADLAMPGPDQDLDAAAAQLAELSSFDPVDEAIARAALRQPDTARALLRQQARWRQLGAKLSVDVKAPATVDAAAIDRLAAALDGMRPVPLTVAVARTRLATTTAVAAVVGTTGAEQDLLFQRLDLAPSTTVEQTRTALNTIGSLAAEPATVRALYRVELLDPLADAALHGERLRAATLRAAHEALAGQLHDGALDGETSTAIEDADLLADSGLFARLFGSAYKSARRRAARLVRDPSDRLATADLLRRLVRHQVEMATFRRDSPVAGWFPPILWKGAESDWNAIQRARAVLLDARRQLADAGADDALTRWLALATDERDRVATAIARVGPTLDKVAGAELGAFAVARVAETLVVRQHALEALDSALAGVGALDDGEIVRAEGNLADRLKAMEAAASAFAELVTHREFGWVDGIDDTLEALARTLAHADLLRAAGGPLPIVRMLTVSPAPLALLGQVIGAGEDWRAACRAWQAADRRLADDAGLQAAGLAPGWGALADRLGQLAADEKGARLAADLRRYSGALADVGLDALGRAGLEGAAPADRLADLYELLTVRALLKAYLGADGAELGRTGGLTLARARASFTRLDKELHELEARAIVAKRLDDRPPTGVGHGRVATFSDMELLDHELALKRSKTPLRDVVHRAGAALQTLKPVWMMSPTSTAQYIRPGTLTFDLLVVDEASQMRPEYAISAVLRGAQFVVVGDANQLPPSDHFQTSGVDGAGGDGTGGDGVGVSEDTESILDLANQRFRRKRRLKWHYRSQHESLIQFSNREFYQGDLIVFPSPMGDGDDLLGVKCRYVADAVYEASINEKEAEAVIEEALRLMLTHPERSIGIAAMNAKQTELINNQFERVVLEQPAIRAYLDEYAGGVDEFFIKNLENVQGDERDIILISTVYGPNKDGKVLQNFGLMNREVGWRRLNVLVTRAKLSTRLFTSLRPNDIKVTDTSNRSIRALHDYLSYAHGGAAYRDASGGEPDSDFELFVADALTQAGYDVVHQVGVDGFRIDLGVRHRDYPVGFIAGVECDGASFHRGLTVRDRDRIRQSVLEGLGWRIYRIWSTDWFADPARELARLVAFLEQHRATFAQDHARRPKAADSSAPEPADPAPTGAAATPAPVPSPPALLAAVEHTGPTGQPMRSLGDIAWYETAKGWSYEVWIDDRLAGEVQVLSRGTAAPRMQGSQVMIARSEYEGHVDATGDRFRVHDVFAAVREVARRARIAGEVPA